MLFMEYLFALNINCCKCHEMDIKKFQFKMLANYLLKFSFEVVCYWA
jgi:hypothetical protein